MIDDDPDAPLGDWIYQIVLNILPINMIKEKSVPGVEGMNDFGKHPCGGPCPSIVVIY